MPSRARRTRKVGRSVRVHVVLVVPVVGLDLAGDPQEELIVGRAEDEAVVPTGQRLLRFGLVEDLRRWESLLELADSFFEFVDAAFQGRRGGKRGILGTGTGKPDKNSRKGREGRSARKWPVTVPLLSAQPAGILDAGRAGSWQQGNYLKPQWIRLSSFAPRKNVLSRSERRRIKQGSHGSAGRPG